MNQALNLGKIAGIKIQVHWSFLLLIAVFVFFGASGKNMMVKQLALLKGHKVEEAVLSY